MCVCVCVCVCVREGDGVWGLKVYGYTSISYPPKKIVTIGDYFRDFLFAFVKGFTFQIRVNSYW